MVYLQCTEYIIIIKKCTHTHKHQGTIFLLPDTPTPPPPTAAQVFLTDGAPWTGAPWTVAPCLSMLFMVDRSVVGLESKRGMGAIIMGEGEHGTDADMPGDDLKAMMSS